MNVFIWGNANTTDRDLKKLTDAGFGWQKTLFQWRYIEPQQKGKFDWDEADRIVKASKAAGVKILARLDQQPAWARADHSRKNGPPDNYQDYADFVTAFVTRYSSTSPIGRVDAIQIWNEQNLNNEWGGAAINQQQAEDYVRLLKLAYEAAKAADPSVTVVTGGVAPDRHRQRRCPPGRHVRPVDVRRRREAILRRARRARPRLQGAADRQPRRGREQPDLRRPPVLRASGASRTCGRSWWTTATATSRSGCSSSAGPATRSIRPTPGTASPKTRRATIWSARTSGRRSTGRRGSA